MLRLRLVALATLSLAACDDPFAVVVTFEPRALALEATQIELAVVPSCAGVVPHRRADGAERLLVITDEDRPALGAVEPVTKGVVARALDDDCAVVATSCADVDFAAVARRGTLDVVLTRPTSCAGEDCVERGCATGRPRLDAGDIDARTPADVAVALDVPPPPPPPPDTGHADVPEPPPDAVVPECVGEGTAHPKVGCVACASGFWAPAIGVPCVTTGVCSFDSMGPRCCFGCVRSDGSCDDFGASDTSCGVDSTPFCVDCAAMGLSCLFGACDSL